jgi:hypothetical protein
MRASTLLAGIGLPGLAFAAVWMFPRIGSDAAPRPASGPAEVLVGDAARVTPSLSGPANSGRDRLSLRFDVDEGETVLGLTTAAVYPEADGRPNLLRGLELEVFQGDGGVLRLGPWLERTRPAGAHHLRYCLLLATREGTEYRAGWARFDVADVLSAGVRVRPDRGTPTTLRVRTAEGTDVPGATVFVAMTPFDMSSGSFTVRTGPDGAARVSGLEPNRDWEALLPEGIGPYRTRVRATFTSPRPEVVLEVAAPGPWAFEPFEVHRQVPGQAATVEEVRGGAKDLLPVWPVSRFLVPGVPSDHLHYLMRRPSDVPPNVLRVHFAGGGSAFLDRTQTPQRLSILFAHPRGAAGGKAAPLPAAAGR